MASKLTKGTYEVTVSGLTDVVLTGSVEVENEKIANIKFNSDVAVLDASNPKIVTTGYTITNQYGEDITKATSGLTVTSSKGAAGMNQGTLTLDNDGSGSGKTDTAYVKDDKVTVTMLDSATATFASKVLTVSDKAQVATLEFKGLYNTNKQKFDVALDEDSTAGEYVLVVEAKDQYGNVVTTTNIASDIVATVSDSTKANIAGGAASPTFSSVVIDGKTYRGIALDGALSAGKSTVSLISKTTGQRAAYDVNVAQGVKVDTISLSAPELAVSGEDVIVPFTAVDQYGNAVTDAKILNKSGNKVTVTSTKGTPVFRQNYVTKKAELVIPTIGTTPTADENVLVTAVTPTGKSAQVTINVRKVAKPAVIVGIKDAAKDLVVGGKTELKGSNVLVNDQYGREVKNLVLGTSANEYKIKVSTSDATKVSITGTNPLAASANALQLNGLAKGTSVIELELQDNAGVVIANSEYTFTSKVTGIDQIAEYKVEDFDVLFEGTGVAAEHNVPVVVKGGTNGSTAVIPKSQYTVVVQDPTVTTANKVTYDSATNKLKNGTAAGDYAAGKNIREITVIVTVFGENGPEVFNKTLTVTTAARKDAKMELQSSTNTTKESANAISAVKTNIDTYTKLQAEIKASLKVTDQYGVVFDDNDDVIQGANILVSNLGTKTLQGWASAGATTLVAGDTFKVTVITDSGNTKVIDVIVK